MVNCARIAGNRMVKTGQRWRLWRIIYNSWGVLPAAVAAAAVLGAAAPAAPLPTDNREGIRNAAAMRGMLTGDLRLYGNLKAA
jgi:hypothetical protein